HETVGHLERQRLYADLADERGEDAAGLHAGRLAGELDRDLRRDRLVEPHLVEVEMRDPAPDRVYLEVLEDRGVRRLLAGQRDVEDCVAAVRAAQHRSQLALGNGDRMRLLPAAVDDAGDETVAPQRSGRGRAYAI